MRHAHLERPSHDSGVVDDDVKMLEVPSDVFAELADRIVICHVQLENLIVW